MRCWRSRRRLAVVSSFPRVRRAWWVSSQRAPLLLCGHMTCIAKPCGSVPHGVMLKAWLEILLTAAVKAVGQAAAASKSVAAATRAQEHWSPPLEDLGPSTRGDFVQVWHCAHHRTCATQPQSRRPWTHYADCARCSDRIRCNEWARHAGVCGARARGRLHVAAGRGNSAGADVRARVA